MKTWKTIPSVITGLFLFVGTAAFGGTIDGLVAHYPFDGDAKDYSGFNNHGIIQGTLPFAEGVVGQAGVFLEPGEVYVEAAHQPQLVLANGFTISCWFKGLRPGRILQKGYPVFGDPGGQFDLLWDDIYQGAGRYLFLHQLPQGIYPTTDYYRFTNSVPTNWTHITVSYDRSQNLFRSFVNGRLLTSEANQRLIALDTTLSLLFMHDRLGASYDSTGFLDDVRVYNRALSDAEVKELAGTGECVPLYNEDFSHNPGWTTDDPAKIVWDSSSGTLHGVQYNTEGTYAYVDLPGFDPNKSWRLEWDQIVNYDGWSAGLTFGLWDPRLLYPYAIGSDMGIGDGGYITTLIHNGSAVGDSNPPWTPGVWYRNTLQYNSSTHQLALTVAHRSNGSVLLTETQSVSSFPTNISRLGVSRVHMKSGGGFNPLARVDYNLDNIQLCGFQATNQPPVARMVVSPVVQFPGVADLLVFSRNGVDVEVVLNGSQSSDPDNDPLTFAWMKGATPLGAEAMITARLPLGAHEITLRVNDGKAAATDTAVVRVLTVLEPFWMIAQMIRDADLEKGRSEALFASLRASFSSFEKGEIGPGVNQLEAFQNKVQAQIAPENPALAADLMNAAQVVINAAKGQ